MTQDEKNKLIDIVMNAQTYYNNIIALSPIDKGPISPMNVTSTLSKAIETAMYVGFESLSAAEIVVSYNNSVIARDIGVAYAELLGYGSITWDNEADAYRHFAWNWLNTEDINANDARLFGDIHELAKHAAEQVADASGLTLAQKVAIGVQVALNIRSNTQSSLSNFNSQFANDDVMDIYNNSQGRRYSVYNSHNNVADAFYKAFYIDNACIGFPSNVTSSIRTTAYSYWQ